jgi:cellulose synthase/poly-beta-1,6-N-acetylglucosamine synthase-like glycosyltransferase
MDLLSFWLVIISLLLFIAYSILIRNYIRGWNACPEFEADPLFVPKDTVTVIVPARNEETAIGNCISSLLQQTYPPSLLEIVVVDDHSEDGTARVVESFSSHNVRLIKLKDFIGNENNSYKKKAIAVGVSHANGDCIITTDADCTSEPNWIREVVRFKESISAEFVAAPVRLQPRQRLLHIFQALDFLTMQAITCAAVFRNMHVMCNGANLAYSKSAFLEVNGFENIDAIASGDDMLLMSKIAERFPGKTGYLKSKNAIVTSQPANTWRAFWQQRIRWASKAGHYQQKNITQILLLVYCFNFSLFALFLVSIWNSDAFIVALLLLLCKIIIEYPLVNSVASFFGQRKLLFYFPFLQPLHLIYVVIAGFLGKFGRYEWKGRKVK